MSSSPVDENNFVTVERLLKFVDKEYPFTNDLSAQEYILKELDPNNSKIHLSIEDAKSFYTTYIKIFPDLDKRFKDSFNTPPPPPPPPAPVPTSTMMSLPTPPLSASTYSIPPPTPPVPTPSTYTTQDIVDLLKKMSITKGAEKRSERSRYNPYSDHPSFLKGKGRESSENISVSMIQEKVLSRIEKLQKQEKKRNKIPRTITEPLGII